MSELEEILSRREFWKRATASIVGTLFYFSSNLDAQAQQGITYSDALMRDGSIRQRYLNQMVSRIKPNYILSVQYATLKELKEKHNGVTVENEYTVTVPLEPDNVGKGTKSRVYVLEEAFPMAFKAIERLHDDLDIRIRNIVINNEFTKAKYFFHGINGYPTDSFQDANGKTNMALLEAVIQILSNSEEYQALIENEKINTSRLLRLRALGIFQSAKKSYNRLLDGNRTMHMDKEFIGRLKHDFNPEKLFKQLN